MPQCRATLVTSSWTNTFSRNSDNIAWVICLHFIPVVMWMCVVVFICTKFLIYPYFNLSNHGLSSYLWKSFFQLISMTSFNVPLFMRNSPKNSKKIEVMFCMWSLKSVHQKQEYLVLFNVWLSHPMKDLFTVQFLQMHSKCVSRMPS